MDTMVYYINLMHGLRRKLYFDYTFIANTSLFT